jgi:hypothetical protein
MRAIARLIEAVPILGLERPRELGASARSSRSSKKEILRD